MASVWDMTYSEIVEDLEKEKSLTDKQKQDRKINSVKSEQQAIKDGRKWSEFDECFYYDYD